MTLDLALANLLEIENREQLNKLSSGDAWGPENRDESVQELLSFSESSALKAVSFIKDLSEESVGDTHSVLSLYFYMFSLQTVLRFFQDLRNVADHDGDLESAQWITTQIQDINESVKTIEKELELHEFFQTDEAL